MKRILVCGGIAVLLALSALPAPSALALDPGNYTVRCASADAAPSDGAAYDIAMDKIDLLTLERSFGAIISGVRLDDGKKVILTGDRGCALTGTAGRSPSR